MSSPILLRLPSLRLAHARVCKPSFSTVAPTPAQQHPPPRIAVVGAGPAGFYASQRILQRLQDARVDMYERLPAPFGLVRYGVAPDHPEVKNCEEKFTETARSPRFTFIGNVAVGHASSSSSSSSLGVTLASLRAHYHAVILAYGASEDRVLGAPGEDLGGVHSARAFVGWYNGAPEFRDLDPCLDGETAVVVGNGNVALDIARVLLMDKEVLARTDIAEHALEKLRMSRVREVRVVGRRGLMQAAFTIKEVRELLRLPGVSFTGIPSHLFPPDLSKLPRSSKRIVELLLNSSQPGPEASRTANDKSFSLDFLLSPQQFIGDAAGRLQAVRFNETALDPADPYAPTAGVRTLPVERDFKAQLCVRSIGQKSVSCVNAEDITLNRQNQDYSTPSNADAAALPFDEKKGVVHHDYAGRVVDPSTTMPASPARILPGLYCTGWVKTGPRGVIATTMMDALGTAETVIRDWETRSGELGGAKDGWGGVQDELKQAGSLSPSSAASMRATSWKDWERIDEVERQRGREKGKSREKITRTEEMLRVL